MVQVSKTSSSSSHTPSHFLGFPIPPPTPPPPTTTTTIQRHAHYTHVAFKRIMQSSCTDPLSRELSVLKLALALTQVLRTYISLLCLTILMLMAARWACDGQRRRDSSAAAGCSRIYAQCDFGDDQAKAFRARGNSPADGDRSCYNVRFQEYPSHSK
jgi:hypothetical protein